MKRLLRSIIDFDGAISAEGLGFNYQRLLSSRIEWQRPDDTRIFRFVREYFQQHMEMPSASTVQDHFTRGNDIEVIERMKDIRSAQGYTKTNYAYLLQTLLEDQNKIKALALLKETQDIIVKGLDFQEGREKYRKQGVREGLVHFGQKCSDLIVPEYNARVQGDIRLDGQEMWDEYQTAKVEKDKVWGKFCGLNDIDTVCHGIKKGELWVHAAFPGHLKTTFALNWAYNLVTRYKTNIVYWSLEMPYEQVRRNIAAMHSANRKWEALGYKPLDYRQIRDGQLSPENEEFYKIVLEDWANNKNYCHFEIMAPDHEVTISDIKLETELLHKQFEVGLVVLDHGQEVEARKQKRSKDYVTELNSVVRDAKRMALHFNHGEKVPVLMLFQINRQGFLEAEKNEGRYKMSAIAYANQVEKSADVLSTTYLDEDHRQRGTTLFCNLKNRDNPLFPPLLASVNFGSRRIHNGLVENTRPVGMTEEVYQGIIQNPGMLDLSGI